jgi:hypothetical protein
MVAKMSMLNVGAVGLVLVSLGFVIFSSLYWVTAAALLGLFALLTMTIPLQLAWYKLDFRGLVWKFIAFMGFGIVCFAMIYMRSGLVASGLHRDVSFVEALYFSITTWATLGYGDYIVPRSFQLITSAETLMGYLSMGVFIGLIALWVSMGLQAHLEYLRRLPELAPKVIRELAEKSPWLKEEFPHYFEEEETDA